MTWASVAKLKEAQTGDLLADKELAIESPEFGFPEPVMSFAITPKSKGDEEKVATAIRRLAEEDPTLRLRRDQQTGEEILSGMSQGSTSRSRSSARSSASASRSSSIHHVSRTARRFAVRRARTAATRSRRVGAASSATATS